MVMAAEKNILLNFLVESHLISFWRYITFQTDIISMTKDRGGGWNRLIFLSHFIGFHVAVTGEPAERRKIGMRGWDSRGRRSLRQCDGCS